jgi:eukaryotic-like serine/threonine-protein kinase
MQLAPGTKLDDYEILDSLGAGGMGEVYRALDPVLKREVAIKILPSFGSQNADRMRRFEQEAQAAASLNHPNILAIYRFGSYHRAPYLVSELLVGETLRQQLERGPLPVRKAVDYGVQVAHGIAAAHDKGIVHRDLKPENLFVTKDGRVKILDFGLAKLTQPQPDLAATKTHATEPGVVMGTQGYMAPEQLRGIAVDHRADIFAFGAVLYEMLAGTRPFQRATSADTMAAILHEDPPAISRIAQTTPPGLQRVVHRCLEKNPEQRFQSASDLAFALEALSGSGISSAASAAPPASRVPRRARAWTAALVALMALAAITYFVIARRASTIPLRISNYTQLTQDGHAGTIAGTDGSRLYLEPTTYSIRQVATAGGEITSVPVSVTDPVLMDVSPDGSTFLLASFTGATMTAHAFWSERILGGSLRYLAKGTDAVWSPDGKSVVYSTENGDLDVVQSDGSGAHKLASVGGLGHSLRWSPDGKTIRFTMRRALWEISSIGSNLHQFLPGWQGYQCCGQWNSDGKTFYFVANDQIWVRDERHTIFGHSSAQPVQLTSGPIAWQSPFPSKDGKTVYASGLTARGELVRFDAKTNQFQPYLAGLDADNLVFSHDGKSIAYVSFPDEILWRADRDGSNRVQLADADLQPSQLSWSPDDTQILFDGVSNGHVAAFVVSSQTGGPRRLLPADPGRESDARWSPDGRNVVFSTSYEGGADAKSDIRMLKIEANKVSILPGSVGMFAPRWSPDGRSIAAVLMNSTNLNIFDLKTQQWSTLYKGVVAYPEWSKDGRSIYFMDFRKDSAVFKLRLSDRVVERIASVSDLHYTGNTGMWMGLDPTDAPLFLRDVGTNDIYALTLEEK